MTTINLEAMKAELMGKTLKELKKIAKGLGLASSSNKEEALIMAILKEHEQAGAGEAGKEESLDDMLNKSEGGTPAGSAEEALLSDPNYNVGIVDRGVSELPLNTLIPSKFNFFKPLSTKKYQEMLQSIKENGVLVPIIVRPSTDGSETYEILAGHNRAKASGELGRTVIPARIVEVDDLKAREIIIDTNVVQRTELSPLEIARAYTEKAEILGNRQGVRSDLTGEAKGSTRDLIGKQFEVSGMTVERYMRLANLTPAFQQALEDGKINVKTGFDLGLVDEKTQLALVKSLNLNKDEDVAKINSRTVGKIKTALSDKNKITADQKKENKKAGVVPEFKPLTKDEVKAIVSVTPDETKKDVVLKITVPAGFDEDVVKFIQDSDAKFLLDLIKDYYNGDLVVRKKDSEDDVAI